MTRADLLVILTCVASIAGLFAWLWAPGASGEWVEIQGADGVERHNLWEARDLEVAGRQGATRVRIDPGRVRVTDSPCTDRVCMQAGWLDEVGDTTACLPNGVVVTISGRAGTRYDAINF
ncbi:MAG: NusG domain II-containing protein [Thiohalocapsa sp.]